MRRVVLVRPYFRGLAATQARSGWSARRRPAGMPRSGWRQPRGDAVRWSARRRPRGLPGRQRRRTTTDPRRRRGSRAVGLLALVLLLTATSHLCPPPLQRHARDCTPRHGRRALRRCHRGNPPQGSRVGDGRWARVPRGGARRRLRRTLLWPSTGCVLPIHVCSAPFTFCPHFCSIFCLGWH